MPVKPMEMSDDEPTVDRDIKDVMEDEIRRAPSTPSELEDRLRQSNAASPADSGGDIDADWEDVNRTGSEAVFGHNPTPDQSDVEDNAHAMGIDFQDNEPLDFVEKLRKRDRDRFELDESSKSSEDMI